MKNEYVLWLIFFISCSLSSQEYIIEGLVKDKNSDPLIGVDIVTENKTGTQTDLDGVFSLKLNKKEDVELTFSYLGFKTKKIIVKPSDSSEKLTIILEINNFVLDEIEIVSNRDRESIDEIPSSVSVLTSKKLEAIASYSNTMAAVVANVPGVSLSTNTSTTRGQNIRGRNMLVLVDGIPQSTPLFVTNRDLNTIDVSVIERVEVIKGSTSIYGNGAEGGIINYITKKGNGYNKIQNSTTIGMTGSLVNTDNTIGSSISQVFKGQIGKFNYVASGTFKETGISRSADNQISSPYYGLGETETYNIFTKLGYDISENSSIELMYNYFSNNQNSNLIRVDGVYGEIPTTGAYGVTNDLEADQGTRYNHNVRLKYLYGDIVKNTDLDVSLYAQEFSTVYEYSTNARFIDEEAGFVGGQNTLKSSKKGARFNFNTNYSLSDDLEGNLIYGLDLLGDTTGQPLLDGRYRTPEMEMTNVAPYLQVKTKYKDFIFKGGIRYENINVDVDDYSTLEGVDVNGGEIKYDAIAFNFGLRYNKIRYIKPFVSFSQSFSVGELGRVLRAATTPNIVTDNIDTEAVIANNYEIGFKSNLTNRIRFQGVYFYSTSDLGVDYIENNLTGVFELSRSPERIYGFELQVDAKLTDKLDFGASLSTVEGKTDNNDNGSFSDEEDGYLSSRRINPTIFRTFVNYQISPKWEARLSSTHSGDRDKFEVNEDGSYSYGNGPITSFLLANLYSSYRLTDKARLTLGISNLFNNDYYTVRSQWAGRDFQYEKGDGINFRLGLNISI